MREGSVEWLMRVAIVAWKRRWAKQRVLLAGQSNKTDGSGLVECEIRAALEGGHCGHIGVMVVRVTDEDGSDGQNTGNKSISR